MRRTPAIATLLLCTAALVPAGPAAAKGLVGLSVCGAKACVDRSAILAPGARANDIIMDAGISVADPGRAPFVRLKLHMGDQGKSYGISTLIYLPGQGLIRSDDGTWHQPGPAAATAYKRAARHVAMLPAAALKLFRPKPVLGTETVTPPQAPARPPARPPARAAAGDGDPSFALLLAGGAAAAVAAAAGAVFLVRRGRPATG